MYSQVPLLRGEIYHDITYGTATTVAESESDFIIKIDTLHLAFTGELWSVYCEEHGENWLRFNGTALYHTRIIRKQANIISGMIPGFHQNYKLVEHSESRHVLGFNQQKSHLNCLFPFVLLTAIERINTLKKCLNFVFAYGL